MGFRIGGPCFLRAFSSYLSAFAETDFYQQPDDLRTSQHPVTWLRIRFLARRAARAGFEDLARASDAEWRLVATTLGLREDYHGFYAEPLEHPVERIIEDMLTEAAPRPYDDAEAAGGGWSAGSDTPVRLLNWAWRVHEAQPDAYAEWEAEQVARLLEG